MAEKNASGGSSKKGRRTLYALAAAAGVACVAYVGTALALKDTIGSGTTVAGVNVGGMTPGEAEDRLAKAIYPNKETPATVSVAGHDVAINPGHFYRIDPEASVKSLTGFTLNPASLWHRGLGEGDKKPGVFTADTAGLSDHIAKQTAKEVPGAARVGTVKFIDGEVNYEPGTPGAMIDADAVTKDVVAHFPSTTSYRAKASLTRQSPFEKELAAFAAGDAKKAMSKPLSITANGETLSIPVKVVSDSISTEVKDGKPRIVVSNLKPFLDYVHGHATDMRVAPIDAKVVWKDAQPSVAAPHAGEDLDTDAIARVVPEALTTSHAVNLPLAETKPAVTESDIDVAKLPSTSIAHFESKLPGGPENANRTKNITLAINTLNGQYVKPGQQFSLLRALGYDFSKERGYVEAGTIQNSLHVDGQAGGVSQVSTVVYNTAFFAGVQLDQHTSHAFYLDRYPVGREATIWNPGVDNKWTNDTGAPILIKASVKDSKVIMDFYGSKKYDVKTWNGPRTDVKAPKWKSVKNVKGCQNTIGSGTPGFDIDVFRQLSKGAKTVKTEKIHTSYQPDDIVRCVN